MAVAGTCQRHQKNDVMERKPLIKMTMSDLQSMVGASDMKDHNHEIMFVGNGLSSDTTWCVSLRNQT